MAACILDLRLECLSVYPYVRHLYIFNDPDADYNDNDITAVTPTYSEDQMLGLTTLTPSLF
jgi:hypothetical protein